MRKFEIAAMQSDSKRLVEALQKAGAVELDKLTDDRFVHLDTKESVAVYEKNAASAEESLRILDEYAPSKGGGMFSGRKGIEKAQFESKADEADKILLSALKIITLRRRITDAKAEIIRCETSLQSLKIWESLDVPMRLEETKDANVYVGTFPKDYDREALVLAISAEIPEMSEFDVEIVFHSKEITAAVIVCHKSVAQDVYKAIRAIGFIAPSDPTKHPPRVRIERYEKEIQKQKEICSDCESSIRELSKLRSDIQFLFDYLTVKKDEYASLDNAAMSGKTIILGGYIPEIRIRKVESIISEYTAAVEFFEPSEDDDVPVLLHNNNFCEPVEGITEMYALPGKKDIDPSSIMAFFYYLLFGMMLSDAGYGLLMVVGTAVILKKTAVEGTMRRSLKMFFYCGISTTIWGALFGSWFGDIIPVICTNFLGFKEAPSLALWFEPIKDPIKLLLFSFIVGICHLFLGVITLGVMEWKAGDKVSALCDTIPIILTVLGAAPLAGNVLTPVPAAITGIAKYVAIVGVVLIVLTNSRSSKNIFTRLGGGLYGLYNVASGYLSDILSYSRLLALGLATGSIASVVNMIGVMPENTVVKAIMLVVVFLIGHPLNMAINVLGAYVHSNRLQFVELFSKFYEGGGRAFKPLKFNTKFFKLKEDSNNG